MLCGLACPSAGAVRWGGRDIRSLREEFGSQMLYLGQANGVKDDLAAWEDLVVATTLGGQPVTREAAYQALEQLGLGQAADLPKRALSPGQRKRVALARLQLGTRQRLWILDEPFTALEHAAVDALCATINGHLAQGGVVVYTTHQEIALDAGRMMRLDLALPC